MIPAWHEKAPCRGRPLSETTLEGRQGPGKRAGALDYCRDCPFTARCAAEAVELKDRGIVRAGVWIPENTAGWTKARRVLRYIADGYEPLALLAGTAP